MGRVKEAETQNLLVAIVIAGPAPGSVIKLVHKLGFLLHHFGWTNPSVVKDAHRYQRHGGLGSVELSKTLRVPDAATAAGFNGADFAAVRAATASDHIE